MTDTEAENGYRLNSPNSIEEQSKRSAAPRRAFLKYDAQHAAPIVRLASDDGKSHLGN
jgi:hypothetical protein